MQKRDKLLNSNVLELFLDQFGLMFSKTNRMDYGGYIIMVIIIFFMWFVLASQKNYIENLMICSTATPQSISV